MLRAFDHPSPPRCGDTTCKALRDSVHAAPPPFDLTTDAYPRVDISRLTMHMNATSHRLQQLLRHGPSEAIARHVGERSNSDVVALLDTLGPDDIASTLAALPVERRQAVFHALPHAQRLAVAQALDRHALVELVVTPPSAPRNFSGQGGITQIFGSISNASTFSLYRARVFWLVLLVFGNLFSGAGIAAFQETIESTIALVFFLPLLVDSGGNAGSQAATLMVRALSTGDVKLKDWGRWIGRDLVVAIALGVTMAVAVSIPGFFRGGAMLALVVALSMVVIVIMASLIGLSIPFILMRLKRDPTVASAPLITSIVDAVGVLIYFSIATALLHPGQIATV